MWPVSSCGRTRSGQRWFSFFFGEVDNVRRDCTVNIITFSATRIDMRRRIVDLFPLLGNETSGGIKQRRHFGDSGRNQSLCPGFCTSGMVSLQLIFAHNYCFLQRRHNILSLRHQFDFSLYNQLADSIFQHFCPVLGRRRRETQKWYSCRWQVNHLSSLQYFDAAPTVICNRRDTREIEYTCQFMRKKIKNSLILRKFSKLWAILGKKIVVSRVSISLEIIGNCLSHSVILICDE